MKFKEAIMKKTTQKETFLMDLKKFCELNNISRRTALNWIKSGKLQTENKFSQGKRIDNVIVTKDLLLSTYFTKKHIVCDKSSLEQLMIKTETSMALLQDIKNGIQLLLEKKA